jgi:tetratricopeptide (TPR) repeat protein
MFGAFAGGAQGKRRYRVLYAVLAVAALLYGAGSGYFFWAAPRLARQAELELKRGQVDDARRQLDWVLWFHRNNAHANLVLGRIELASGALNEAIRCFRNISATSSVHEQASLEIAKALALNGQITAAELELKEFLKRYEPIESFWDLYFRLMYLQTRTRDVIALFEKKLSTPPQTLSDAGFLLKAEFVPQDPRDTLEPLEEIVRKHPDDINAQVALAFGLLRGREVTRADQLLRNALDRQPDHHQARLVLAQWLSDKNKFSEAESILWQTSGAPNPDSTDEISSDDRYWSLSSRLAEQNGKTELALQYIDRALRIRDYDKKYLSQRSQILRQLSRPQEATIAAQQSVEAGQIEQELFLLAREFENRPISMADCQVVASLYLKLKRPGRAELWGQLAAQLKQNQPATSDLEGGGVQ